MKAGIYREEFRIEHAGKLLFAAAKDRPAIWTGCGEEEVRMYRGNYRIEDYVTSRVPLSLTGIEPSGADEWLLSFGDQLTMTVTQKEEVITLRFCCPDRSVNRFWIRFGSDVDEKLYGGGEQMSYFNMKGRHFPLWTSEPGVGRDKTTYVTWRSDVENRAGGDYYNTNYPEPLYVSSRHYYLHADSTAYADFDFRHGDYNELQFWEVPEQIRLEGADTFPELTGKLTAYLGRQPRLPEWVDNGLILGVQGGTERVSELLDRCLERGIRIAGLWCQDWCGKRVTSFGKRLQWDWHFHEQMYPELPDRISALHKRGIRFMGYINPYLVEDGILYREGHEKGYFAKKSDGSEYLVDFGEFNCGVVDLTNPEAFDWFKGIIRKYMLEIGMDGWMADFGEYLPTDDIVLSSEKPAMIEHNHWPVLWAKCNYEALEEAGKLEEAVYFMRAGGAGSQKYCTLLWAGDQSVDFSRHDGLCTILPSALSAGMSGNAYHHSDIGGYTSLFGNVRTKELMLRWIEEAAFTPVMRTHEGNRPDENLQFYDEEDCLTQMARMTAVFSALAPYRRALIEEAASKGYPLQRPLFFHYEEDRRCQEEQFEYLLGEDLLVAPVCTEGAVEREVYLPQDEWVHFWTGKEYGGGTVKVDAPIGQIPVFYRKASGWADLFQKAALEK